MTQAADILRDQRQAYALPGGFHDRLVSRLATLLPAGIGLILAIMVLSPLTPRGEISFLLDRNKVALAHDRVKVENAMYRGVDGQGRAFSVNAQSAVQEVASNPVVRMERLSAQLGLSEGQAQISASDGLYNYDKETVRVAGQVEVSAPDGYNLVTKNVDIDLKQRLVRGTGGIEGTLPAGAFSASQLRVDLGSRTVTLEGNAHLRMVPGQMRMPR